MKSNTKIKYREYTFNIKKSIPKRKSLEKVTQKDLYEVVSNINSLKKKKYEGKTPNEML